MKQMTVAEKMKFVLNTKTSGVDARLFVSRDDGITVFDSVQDQTTYSVSALVSGVWQASEALVGLVRPGQDALEFRLGFDTSSQGVLLFPLTAAGKKYFFGAIYNDCVNPGLLKRKITLIKEELERFLADNETKTVNVREGFLFKDITDEEMDRLFSVGGF